MKLRAPCVVLVLLSLAQLTYAQSAAETASALPRLVRFAGAVKDLNGNPLAGVVGITFALYAEQNRRSCALGGDAERHCRQQRPLCGSVGIDEA